MKQIYDNRIGEEKLNNKGSKMKIIEYINMNNIVVEFENGYQIKTRYQEFKNGKVRNPYDKTVYDIGFIGEGKYTVTNKRNLTNTGQTWHGMFDRCYNTKRKLKNPTYKDCFVCEEWHNYQTFAEWYERNYYSVNNESMDLDKDILITGNKIYSPNTCIFVPHTINMLFINNTRDNKKLPMGVRIINRPKPYSSRYNDIYLGCYNTIKEAFESYKNYRESYIKEVADKYKNSIPQKLYNALYTYEVEIAN